MLFGKYEINATLLDDAVLPPYKGSTFRGAFGNCLKKVVCAVKKKECAACLLAERCIYARLFETKSWQTTAQTRTAAPPHPYLIEPPQTAKTHFKAGEPFNFTLVLCGEMNNFLPYFIYAFKLMGEEGIGKKIADHRSRFQMQAVRCQDIDLYDPKSDKLLPLPPLKQLSLDKTCPNDETHTIKIDLKTPLRLKSRNELQNNLPFALLVRAMLRRVSSLFNYWGEGEPSLDYRGMVQRAEQVEVAARNLYWHEWERYSNRQETAMNFGGMLGSITYKGNLNEYLPLLQLCSQLHIGKQTTFGLGSFKLEIIP